MAKYTGINMVATMGSVGFDCLTNVDVDMSADVYTASCAGTTFKVRVVGPTNATFTLNFMMDDSSKAVATGLPPGTTGTFSFSSNGTIGPTYTCAGIVESARLSVPADNIVGGTVVVGSDGTVTIA